MSTPRVSVCLPNLNTRPFLEERMESILSQTFPDWELIICDSYSDDGSWEFFQKFEGDPRVRMCQVPREGAYAGWNECLRRATGEYVYIATSDDTASSQLLEKLVSPLERFNELKVAVCDFAYINKDSKLVERPSTPAHEFLGEWMTVPSIRNGKTEFLLHAAFATTIWVTMTSVLFRRGLLSQTGLFRTDMGSRADEDWTLRASLASDIAFVPGKLATWRVHDAQATPQRTDWKGRKVLLDCLKSVLHDRDAGVPPSWKGIPDFEERICEVRQMTYRESFRLYRWAARRSFGEFGKNCWAALTHHPTWFIAQASKGFGWSDDHEPDRAAAAVRLIKLFDVRWPPQKVTTDWYAPALPNS